jgi:hypothetical protein
LSCVRQGFKNHSEKSEGFVAAKSNLLLNAFEGSKPDIRINPALVNVSSGTLLLSENIVVNKLKGKEIQFTWDNAHVPGGSENDQVALLAYDIENEEAYYSLTGQFRKTGSDRLRLGYRNGITYQVYFSFIAADRSRQSNSIYLGTITR